MYADLVIASDVQANIDGFWALAPGVQANLVSAASQAIQADCDRVLASTALLENHEPGRSREVRLRQYPVSDITRLAASAQPVMTAQFTDTAAQRANVAQTTSGDPPYTSVTGLRLTSVKNGVTTVTPLLFSTYTTLGTLATAINAVSGWTTTIASNTSFPLSGWATSDIAIEVGAREAYAFPVYLWAFIREVIDYELVSETGRITLSGVWPVGLGPGVFGETYRFPDRTWGVDRRVGQVRVAYQAGYTSVPMDLQNATMHLISAMMDRAYESGLLSQDRQGTDLQSFAPLAKGLMGLIEDRIKRYRRKSFA